MGIVSISRGTKSGGILLAEAVGERLGATVLGREDLIAGHGDLAAIKEQLREEMDTFPEYLWEEVESLRHAYLCMLRSVLLDRAADGPLVYHANGGNLLLRGVPGLLDARVVAPVALRVRMIADRLGLEPRKATRFIHDTDRRRETWSRAGDTWSRCASAPRATSRARPG